MACRTLQALWPLECDCARVYREAGINRLQACRLVPSRGRGVAHPVAALTQMGKWLEYTTFSAKSPAKKGLSPAQKSPRPKEEFSAVLLRFQRTFDDVCDMQRALRLRSGSPEREILGGLDGDLLEPPRSVQAVLDDLFGRQKAEPTGIRLKGKVYAPEWRSTEEARNGARLLLASVHQLDGLKARLAKALDENADAVTKARHLIWALASRLGALEDRLAENERQLSALQHNRRRS
jgi:hypothetical protein